MPATHKLNIYKSMPATHRLNIHKSMPATIQPEVADSNQCSDNFLPQ